jgi:hypothetical protein
MTYAAILCLQAARREYAAALAADDGEYEFNGDYDDKKMRVKKAADKLRAAENEVFQITKEKNENRVL